MVKPERLAALVPLTGLELVVDARGDRQLPADRLDPILTTVLINERGHYFRWRSSSAWAKNAEGFPNMPTDLQAIIATVAHACGPAVFGLKFPLGIIDLTDGRSGKRLLRGSRKVCPNASIHPNQLGCADRHGRCSSHS